LKFGSSAGDPAADTIHFGENKEVETKKTTKGRRNPFGLDMGEVIWVFPKMLSYNFF
jgi:hypothetical protein